MRCPTLWLIGTKNHATIDSYRGYESSLKNSSVEVSILDGLNHPQEFTEIDRVFPVMLSFILGKI